jgi:predicted SPOUT superfamily RNA methylase MTH1
MKFMTRSLRSLATKLHILARQADIFGINHLYLYFRGKNHMIQNIQNTLPQNIGHK